MRQITVQLEDHEMVRLEAVARARHIEPAEVLKSEALKIATGSVVKVVKGRYSSGIGAQRKMQADFSVTEAELKQFLKLSLRGGAAFRLQGKLAKMNAMITYGGAARMQRQTEIMQATEDTAKEERRKRRLAILMRSNGIFAGDPGKPKDGLVYQKELRAEWQ